MKLKILVIFVMTLLIATAIPAVGTIKDLIIIESNDYNEPSKSDYPTTQNGVILDQVVDENYNGYTVMSVWGSDYEMGYAKAELLGDYFVQIFYSFKESLGENYNPARELAADLVWMPPGIEDEMDGILDYLAVTYPSENIDEMDFKVAQMIGEWWYHGCRAHMCWGRYVEDPIKTLTTMRLDWGYDLFHNILCACDPDDGSTRRVHFGWGESGLNTAVNEFGIVIRNQDYNSYDLDLTAGRMPRGIASRYALTFANNPDVSTHLDSVYAELQNYEITSGGFLNYYAPEGQGGVMTSNPLQTGSDFYHLRKPQESWHHGEAMITTNTWTDGTYTPSDEDFGADLYYDDESPKTLESHWNLLVTGPHQWKNLQLFSVAYRGPADMTIWADGKISPSSERTPRLEYEWNDLFFEPPIMNEIDGLTSGKAGEEHEYTFSATDPDGDDVTYGIDWGDNTDEESFGPYPSDELHTAKHVWEKGDYVIKVKAVDTYGKESDWATLEVSMPKTKAINTQFLTFLENHPYLFQLLRQILGL